MNVLDVAIGGLAILLIAAILHDAFEVMLLPRRIKSERRIVRYFFKGTWSAWSGVGRRISAEDRRHDFLGLYGPLSLIVLIIVWAIGLIVAFGTVFWALNPSQFTRHHWLNQAYFSGVTFFTLGYGDIVPHAAWSKVVAVFEAGTGLGFIAMVIGYLPVIYQLFSRREAHVITLDALAGSPPSAGRLLIRYAEGESLHQLDALLREWQQWCAELLEGQLSYPMLSYYRSQHDNQSWLAALTAIMDTCVLVMVGLDGVRTLQARLTFATARLACIEIGRVLGAGPRPSSLDRMTSSNFQQLRSAFDENELCFVDESKAEERLASFRDTYEPFLNGLAEHLILPLPCFALPDQPMDNWANSPRGRSAKRLIEAVVATPVVDDAADSKDEER